MERPYIICNMMTALDGRITGPFLFDAHTERAIEEYDKIHESFGAQAWLCGRKTMEENFTLGEKPSDSWDGTVFPRTDHLAETDAKVYCLSLDPSGKLGWPQNHIDPYSGRAKAHIVEILTEQVADRYLDFLRKKGISYLFAGKETIDLHLLLHKVKTVLGVETMLLEGGGGLNGTFHKEGLLDELSLVLTPTADGCTDTPTLFDRAKAGDGDTVLRFLLTSVEKIGENELWIRYRKA